MQTRTREIKSIKVAVAELNQTSLDWQRNKENIVSAIKQAKNKKVNILCLPELCISGYGCEDYFLSETTQRTSLSILKEIIFETKDLIVCLGLPLSFEDKLFDAVCLIANTKILGFVAKQFLAREGIHYEPRWFNPWPKGKTSEISIFGNDYPIGDMIFNCGGVKIGFEICEDAWVKERPARSLSLAGAEIVLNPSASHFAFNKFEVRKKLVLEATRELSVAYLYSNLIGNEAGRMIYDGGGLIANCGELIAIGERFSYKDVSLTIEDLDIEKLRKRRLKEKKQQKNAFSNKVFQVCSEFSFSESKSKGTKLQQSSWGNSEFLKQEDFTRAIALGLFDYLRKSRSHGYVVSLSGGADSTATACLVYLMFKLVVKELGLKEFKDKLSYIDFVKKAKTEEEILENLLTCVYQATKKQL